MTSQIILTEGAGAAAPGTGKQAVYFKTDGHLYSKDDAGVEIDLSAPASDAVIEGVVNLFLTNARVIGALLTGLVSSGGAIAATDSILQAFGKVKHFEDAFSAFALTLIDDADAAAARTTLALGTSAVIDVDTDVTLAANSDAKIATQKAVKTAIANAIINALKFQGSTNASANPNYPAAVKGDSYVVSVAGKIGGAAGKAVDVGDMYVANADNAGGTEAAVGTSWFVLEHNLLGALLTANNLSDLASATTALTNLGFSANGKSLVTAADYAAMRILLGTDAIFKTIAVLGQSDVVADSNTDTLTLVAGTNVTLTTDASTDAITITATGGSTSPGGADTNVQFDDGGAFGGNAGFKYNKTTNVVTLTNGSEVFTVTPTTSDKTKLATTTKFQIQYGNFGLEIVNGANTNQTFSFFQNGFGLNRDAGAAFNIVYPSRLFDQTNWPINIIGQTATTNVTIATNIVGGAVNLLAGDGALHATGAANGGAINLDGGTPFGTGIAGDINVGATRGRLVVSQEAIFAKTLKLASYTVGTLPSASTSGAGATACVTDSNQTTTAGIGTTVAAGGANFNLVVSNGTNWIIS